MTRSMTGFASAEGHAGDWQWSWDLRSVNGRGLDLRLRIPDWIDGLEAALRTQLQAVANRGNVTLSLKLSRADGAADLSLNTDALNRALTLLAEVEVQAANAKLALAPTTSAEILGLRGVLETGATVSDTGPLKAALLDSLENVLSEFVAMRSTEGAALEAVLSGQVDQIEELVGQARDHLPDRSEKASAALTSALHKVIETADGMDPDRVTQELALIAVKTDVAEELDRLDGHVSAARELVAGDGPKGRKLDFLIQEFNREANTLCSKAQFAPLTRVGLDLKHVIDQMREQVQNVE